MQVFVKSLVNRLHASWKRSAVVALAAIAFSPALALGLLVDRPRRLGAALAGTAVWCGWLWFYLGNTVMIYRAGSLAEFSDIAFASHIGHAVYVPFSWLAVGVAMRWIWDKHRNACPAAAVMAVAVCGLHLSGGYADTAYRDYMREVSRKLGGVDALRAFQAEFERSHGTIGMEGANDSLKLAYLVHRVQLKSFHKEPPKTLDAFVSLVAGSCAEDEGEPDFLCRTPLVKDRMKMITPLSQG
jgi:hypothetical protein